MPDDAYDDLIRGVVKSIPTRRGRYDEDTALDLIAHHESGGRNIKQQVVPPGGGYNPSVGRVTGPSSASGPWQITNTTWRKRAPREIAEKYPTAMSAPVEVQRAVAGKIFRETGFQDWAPYNASLRRAIARGEQPQRPQQPADDEYSKLISEVLSSEQPSAPPVVEQPQSSRTSGRGRGQSQPRRRQQQQGQVEASGLGAPPVAIADLRQRDEVAIQQGDTNRQAVRQQVRRERMSDAPLPAQLFAKGMRMFGPQGTPVLTAVREIASGEDALVGEEVERRLAEQRLAETPEVVEGRKDFGSQAAPVRALTMPAGRAGATLVRQLAGLSSAFGIAPNEASEYLNQRAAVLEQSASLAPLDPQGQEIERWKAEKAGGAVLDVGFTVAQLIAMKKATGLSLSKIMMLETALRTSDQPVKERAAQVAQAGVMGRALDVQMSRSMGAAVNVVPTLAQEVPAVAAGQRDPWDAAINTAVQAGTGALLTSPRRAPALEPMPEVVTREAAPTLRPSELAKRVALRGDGHETQAIETGESTVPITSQLRPEDAAAKPSRTADAGVRVRPDARGRVERETQPADIVPTELGGRSLTRNFRAGPNNAEMVFESDIQRDLYDLGAKMRYQMRGGRNRASQREVGDIEGLKRSLIERGVPEAELTNRAFETLDDVRTQMKGVKDGETRQVKDKFAVQPPVETRVAGEKPRGATPLAGERTQATAERPVEPVKPQWQHRDFGRVEASDNQSGVGRGRVRVTAEDGSEHVIRRSKGTGAGNQIAIPVRSERRAEASERRGGSERRISVQAIERPTTPATEDVVRKAQSPSDPETHPTIRRVLTSEFKDRILKEIGSDAKPLNPTELGGIKASSVSFEKSDGSIVTVADAAFADAKPTYGSKRDGFVVTRSAPIRSNPTEQRAGERRQGERRTATPAATGGQKPPWELTQADYLERGIVYRGRVPDPSDQSRTVVRTAPEPFEGATPVKTAPKDIGARGFGAAMHKRVVETALREGRPVPDAVLRDYPDLASRQGGPTEPATLPPAAVKPAQRPSEEAARQVEAASPAPRTVPPLKPAESTTTKPPPPWTKGQVDAEEMSQAEFVADLIERRGNKSGNAERTYAAQHERMVRAAARDGLPISDKALADYPDLRPPPAPVKSAKLPEQKAESAPVKLPKPSEQKPPAAPVEAVKAPERGELSLPKSLEKAGLPGGDVRFYDVKTNVESEARAKAIIKERGIDGARNWVQAGEQPSAEQSATALELIKGLAREAEAAPADVKAAKLSQAGDLASTMAVRVKEQGQAIQYLYTLAKESPEGALYYAESRIKRQSPDARLTAEQRNGVFDTAVKLKATEAELAATRTKLADVERMLSESRTTRREPQVTRRLRDWADQAEKDARARLASRTGVKGSEAGASTIPADIADYAIIGAAKMARGTANFAEWSAQMVSDFGEDIKPQLRRIRSESERLVNEQSQLARHGKTVDEIARLAGKRGFDARAIDAANKFVRGMSRTDFHREAMKSGLTRQQAHDLAVEGYKLYSEANRSLRQAGKERRAEEEEPDASPQRKAELIAQRDALMRQRAKERRELAAMMKQIEEGRPSVLRRVNNQFRGIIVSALQTASRNITTQVPRVVVEDMTKAFELAFVKGKSQLGWTLKEGDIDPRTRMLDTFKSSAYLLQRNKRITEGILDEFPVEYEQMFRRFSSDVDITPQTGISKGVHKGLDKIDKAIEIVNTPNRFQEFLVRRAVFRGELEASLRAEGVDLNKTIAEGRQGEIDRAKVQRAVNEALRVTFADSPRSGSLGDSFIHFTSSIPAPINPLTFSRFLYNGAKFTLEYQPTTALRGLYRTARGKPGAASDYAKAAVGTVMLTTAVQAYDAMHKDGSEWYLLDVPGVGEIDIRPYQPFASYIFASHWIRTKQTGRPVSYEGTRAGNVGTYVEGLTGLSARPVPVYEVAKAAASESQEWDGVLRQIKRVGGETVAGLLTPLKTPKQIIAQFDEQEAIVRDTSQHPITGPIRRNIPFASRSLPPLVRNEEIVTQPNPALQTLGVRTVMPDKRSEAEKLTQKLLRRPYDEARTDEEITRSKQTADLRARARRGESVDLSALPPRQRTSIEKSVGMTRPEETFKRLSLEQLLTVWKSNTLTAEERPLVKSLLAEQADDAMKNYDPSKQEQVKAQLRAIGIVPIEELPPDKQREIVGKRRLESREQSRQRREKQRAQGRQRPSLGYGY